MSLSGDAAARSVRPGVDVQDVDGEIVIRVRRTAPATTGASDELRAFPFGLEARAATALVRSGMLKAARIGRRLYARQSDVLALVDKLAPPAPIARAAAENPAAAYAEMVNAPMRRSRR